LQLASPALPVGAYSYSQGLEWAIEAGTVKDEAGALRWIGDQLEWNIGRYEAPLLLRMMDAWKVGADDTARELDER
jgi:urease accessory protein